MFKSRAVTEISVIYISNICQVIVQLRVVDKKANKNIFKNNL